MAAANPKRIAQLDYFRPLDQMTRVRGLASEFFQEMCWGSLDCGWNDSVRRWSGTSGRSSVGGRAGGTKLKKCPREISRIDFERDSAQTQTPSRGRRLDEAPRTPRFTEILSHFFVIRAQMTQIFLRDFFGVAVEIFQSAGFLASVHDLLHLLHDVPEILHV